MNSIKSFLVELGYHLNSEAEFSTKGAQLYLTVKNMSQTTALRLVKKHFPEATLFTLKEKDTVFRLF